VDGDGATLSLRTLQQVCFNVRLPKTTAHSTTDDQAGHKIDKSMMQRVKDLGQITVEFWRVEIHEKAESSNGYCWNDEKGKISEKALKGKAISRKAGSVTL
jgi:hypothetical protein